MTLHNFEAAQGFTAGVMCKSESSVALLRSAILKNFILGFSLTCHSIFGKPLRTR